MNTATFAATAARFHFTLPAGLLAVLERAVVSTAPAAPVARVLAKCDTTWITRPLGRTVTCETGTLWLTFDNEAADVILEAGQSHRCAKASKLAIHALAAARVSVA
jgi:Protein of unknown function (DUF2917)